MNARALSHFLGPVLLLLVGVLGRMQQCRNHHHSADPRTWSRKLGQRCH